MNRLLFDHKDDTSAYLAKFATQSTRTRSLQFLENNERSQQWLAFDLLATYLRRTTELLRRSAELNHNRQLVRHARSNHNQNDTQFLDRLMDDPSITIKPADKNLGMALVDTQWYITELQRMLSDKITYQPFNHSRIVKGVIRPYSIQQLQTELLTNLQQLCKFHANSFTLWNSLYAESVLKFLTRSVTASTCLLPTIYLLIKVHKPSGLCGRPIVPSTHWLTTPPSVVVDHLLQEVVRKADIKHIVKDTKSFVVELENTIVPSADGIFITADIASLYTNIDTEMGLQLVRQFLVDCEVNATHISLIMDLLTFVMKNSYLQFRDKIYHQIDGTAMGTAAAPIYANIVVYMLEKNVIREMEQSVFLYRRFLDDVFAYIHPTAASEFMLRMNMLHPKLRFDFVTHPTESAFLDLRIHKGARFQTSRIFDLSVHQKKMNLYLYIPFHSFHTDAMKRSFIQTELMRYIRNSSDRKEYAQLKQTFFQRLRDRGYPSSFLVPIFDSIHYQDRCFFLSNTAELLQHPLRQTQPPMSLCLQRRIQRLQESQVKSGISSPPAVFIIPYSPLSRVLPTRSILTKYWELVQEALDGDSPAPRTPKPIIAYQSESSLLKKLVFQRANRLEKKRIATQTQVPMVQRRIHSYFTSVLETLMVQPKIISSFNSKTQANSVHQLD